MRNDDNERRRDPNRAARLSQWHRLLIEQLLHGEFEDRLDALVEHPALAVPERTFLQAQLAKQRGDDEAASRLIREFLIKLPGHGEFLAFAQEISA